MISIGNRIVHRVDGRTGIVTSVGARIGVLWDNSVEEADRTGTPAPIWMEMPEDIALPSDRAEELDRVANPVVVVQRAGSVLLFDSREAAEAYIEIRKAAGDRRSPKFEVFERTIWSMGQVSHYLAKGDRC